MDGSTRTARQYPVGAELITSDEIGVRVWAPAHRDVGLWIDGRVVPMEQEPGGYFSIDTRAGEGSRYGFVFVDDDFVYPDPASKWQPEGPEKPSAIVDLGKFEWTDRGWAGCELRGQVLYEMHVGTFTAEGTWRAAEREFKRLHDTGITVLQVMPIAEFPGTFGWGYDGVNWFAPQHTYGDPSDFQHFVDAAHHAGLGVILDVVYNHVGPSGNFLPKFAEHYFAKDHETEWGPALNFDTGDSSGLRQLVLANVSYWITEFHLDGLRLDATQAIADNSKTHILAALSQTAREAAAPRKVILVAEHEPQHSRLMRSPARDGYGLDGIYNEDFHHSCRVALTGFREAYLSDYRGTSHEWLSALQWGFLFQGQFYPWQDAPRGAPALDGAPHQFVCFLENHDQVANAALGRRLADMASPSCWRAMSALLLLGPGTPLLFQGQESGDRTPFQYFADHREQIQNMVFEGRREFLEQFTRLIGDVPDLADNGDVGRRAFDRSRRLTPPGEENAIRRLYRDALTLRREDGTLGDSGAQAGARIAGGTAGDRTLVLRYIGATAKQDRLMVVNLGPDLDLAPLPLPIAAPPEGCYWSVLFCSDDRKYDGCGIVASQPPVSMMATGHATTVFIPVADDLAWQH